MTESYNKISEQEFNYIREHYYPQLIKITSIYLPELDLSGGIPMTTEYLDSIRGLWLNDKSLDRIPFEEIVGGLGFALGIILQNKDNYIWHLGHEDNQEFITMLKRTNSGESISIPPFTFVNERETLLNVDVFSDLFKDLRKE